MAAFEPHRYMDCIKSLGYLGSLQEGEPIQGIPELGESRVLEHINLLVQYLDDSCMNHTIGSADYGRLKNLELMLQSLIEQNNGACINSVDAKRIRRYASNIETILYDESKYLLVHEVGGPDFGPDRTQELVNDITSLFDPGVFDSLPMVATKNFTEAGMALAFQLPMSAAMLSFRGCEALFRAYFFLAGIQQHGSQRDPMRTFDRLLDDLGKLWEHKDTFGQTLDFIRTLSHIRNRTVHPSPGVWYNIGQALTIFNLCTDACSLMIHDLVAIEIEKFRQFGNESTESSSMAWDEVRGRLHSADIQELFKCNPDGATD